VVAGGLNRVNPGQPVRIAGAGEPAEQGAPGGGPPRGRAAP
jgi:hypothetical protein